MMSLPAPADLLVSLDLFGWLANARETPTNVRVPSSCQLSHCSESENSLSASADGLMFNPRVALSRGIGGKEDA